MDSDTLPEESPAERRRQRVRTAILDAAERVFSNEGEAGLSIRRLPKRSITRPQRSTNISAPRRNSSMS